MVCLQTKTKNIPFHQSKFFREHQWKVHFGTVSLPSTWPKVWSKFHYKVTWNSAWVPNWFSISRVLNFAILVRQDFAGFYFRDFKRQKKRSKSRWKGDTRVFTISFSCCFMGLTGISKHWVYIVLMMYFQVYINYQLSVLQIETLKKLLSSF